MGYKKKKKKDKIVPWAILVCNPQALPPPTSPLTAQIINLVRKLRSESFVYKRFYYYINISHRTYYNAMTSKTI